MTVLASLPREQRIAAALAAKPDGVLEVIAASCGVSLLQVLEALPDGQVRFRPGTDFETVWAQLTQWGEVLFIVHTPDIVVECTGCLPEGSISHGYFNIHGDSPIAGHIRISNCSSIAIVDRPFHGRRSCSLQFLNDEGAAMFKVFVRRDKDRNLDAEQLALFAALAAWRQD